LWQRGLGQKAGEQQRAENYAFFEFPQHVSITCLGFIWRQSQLARYLAALSCMARQ
jgi:hypothetical protein